MKSIHKLSVWLLAGSFISEQFVQFKLLEHIFLVNGFNVNILFNYTLFCAAVI